MVTKEDINKLAALLSEMTKTLHKATALVAGMVEEIGKQPEKMPQEKVPQEKIPQEKIPKRPTGATHTVVDKFKAHASINDTITNSEPAITTRQPIHDIKKAITIIDRFQFIKELFDDDDALFSQTISRLNAMSSLEEAKNHMRTAVKNWDEASEPAQHFLAIVQRRYL
jgi:hypothetical protein